MECNKKGCIGELIKLKSYYVCNKCCNDFISYKEITNIVKEKRGALTIKPKGKSIEILHPELSGFYKYNINNKTEWRKKFTIYGKDNKLIGSIEMEDYRKASFIIHYNGPSCVVHMRGENYIETFSIDPQDIVFYK